MIILLQVCMPWLRFTVETTLMDDGKAEAKEVAPQGIKGGSGGDFTAETQNDWRGYNEFGFGGNRNTPEGEQ